MDLNKISDYTVIENKAQPEDVNEIESNTILYKLLYEDESKINDNDIVKKRKNYLDFNINNINLDLNE